MLYGVVNKTMVINGLEKWYGRTSEADEILKIEEKQQKRKEAFSVLSKEIFGPTFIHPRTNIEWPHFLTSQFGPRKVTALNDKKETQHYGIDLVPRDDKKNMAVTYGKNANKNFPIKCVGDGKVVEVGFEKRGMGHYVIVEHLNGFRTVYGHLQNRGLPAKNSSIKKGDRLGYLGNSGKRTTGPHLHFELRTGTNQLSAVDPLSEIGTRHLASITKPVRTVTEVAVNENHFQYFYNRYVGAH